MELNGIIRSSIMPWPGHSRHACTLVIHCNHIYYHQLREILNDASKMSKSVIDELGHATTGCLQRGLLPSRRQGPEVVNIQCVLKPSVRLKLRAPWACCWDRTKQVINAQIVLRLIKQCLASISRARKKGSGRVIWLYSCLGATDVVLELPKC